MSHGNNNNNDFLKFLKNERKNINVDKNDELINLLYNNCLHQIKLTNSFNITSLVYECPYYTLGFPSYDIKSVTLEINKKLKAMGFTTIFTKPNKILISWK